MVREAVQQGAQVAAGGARPGAEALLRAGDSSLLGGHFYQPTVLTGGQGGEGGVGELHWAACSRVPPGLRAIGPCCSCMGCPLHASSPHNSILLCRLLRHHPSYTGVTPDMGVFQEEIFGPHPAPHKLLFCWPAGATPNMRVFQEEIFGPVTPVTAFASEAEAVALANATPYGLAAYVYTRDPRSMWALPEALEFGMVGVNEVSVTSEAAPFGGVKQSGMGIECSKYGLQEYEQVKTVVMRC